MSMRHARYVIEENVPGKPMVIRDIGEPWDRNPTITNDVEWVVANLAARGTLPEGRQLFYYDSEGNRDQINVEGGRFAGFSPIEKEAP